ncbi:hypothetical protein DF141_10555 [Burkholderia cenocepacia]|nr:hypothetical protein DF147_00785 [Burkholderia cenocepacia]RQU77208.1 hypothetical protein DF141_10555 [Burkholderia cenocepacia]RQU92054.1 hypothetical protein DF133_09935 [Burkholderia cenocepacia]RQV68577.1 hypothetical protein DF024_03060 [Burkholderia cenocepacia]RQV91584.1 hypothetical protein DF019_00785 [Burkholderia cenocepacia]
MHRFDTPRRIRMMSPRPPSPAVAVEPDDDPSSAGISTLPDSGAMVNVRGVAYVIELPPRDHARPALWRELAHWRNDRSGDHASDGDAERDAPQG